MPKADPMNAVKSVETDRNGNPVRFLYQAPGTEEAQWVNVNEPEDTAGYLAEKVGYGWDYSSIKVIRDKMLGKSGK